MLFFITENILFTPCKITPRFSPPSLGNTSNLFLAHGTGHMTISEVICLSSPRLLYIFILEISSCAWISLKRTELSSYSQIQGDKVFNGDPVWENHTGEVSDLQRMDEHRAKRTPVQDPLPDEARKYTFLASEQKFSLLHLIPRTACMWRRETTLVFKKKALSRSNLDKCKTMLYKVGLFPALLLFLTFSP